MTVHIGSVIILRDKFATLTLTLPSIAWARWCIVRQVPASRQGSYYGVIETRTNGFRAIHNGRKENLRRRSSSFEISRVNLARSTEKRGTLTIKSFALIATAGYPSGKLQSWISSVKKPLELLGVRELPRALSAAVS